MFAVGRSIVRRLLSETVKWSVLRSCSFLVILPDIGDICCNITFSKVNYAFNKLDSEKMIIDRQRNFFKVTPDLECEICEICETFKM